MRMLLGCLLAVLAAFVLLAGLCFDYALWSLWGIDIPFAGDCAAGFVSAPVAIPAGLVCWILRSYGLEIPFFQKAGGTS